jgi:hypothetical protein
MSDGYRVSPSSALSGPTGHGRIGPTANSYTPGPPLQKAATITSSRQGAYPPNADELGKDSYVYPLRQI